MSELLEKEKKQCSENLKKLKETINAIDYLLSDEPDIQDRPFTINDLFLKDKDLGKRCAELLVEQVKCLFRVLLRKTNMNYDCLNYLLCENDASERDLHVIEKDNSVHIMFNEIDTINCQSLMNFTDQFLKVIGVSTFPLLKDFGSYTRTSFGDNVDDTPGVPERKGDREDNDDTDSNDSLVSFKDFDDGSPLHDSGNNIDFREEKEKKKIREDIVNDDIDRGDFCDFSSLYSENEGATITFQACNDVDESSPRDDYVVPRSDNSENEESTSTISRAYSENEEYGSIASQECKDLDESILFDSENNTSFYETKKAREGINIDDTDGDDSYDFISRNSENESAITSQARNDVDESATRDDSVVPGSNKSENEESGSTTSQECKDRDETTLYNFVNNISYHEKKAKKGINVENTESPQSSEGCYTFESFKKIVLQKYEELNQFYEKKISLKCKVIVLYTDAKGEFQVIECGSNREANLVAYSLKDIFEDPFPVVFIKSTVKKSSVSLKEMKANSSIKVGQRETPSMCAVLYNKAISEKDLGFPLSFKLDTGADSGSVGYNYDIIKHFILIVATINDELEPAILCKVKSDTIDGDGVQIFDIDGDSNWNAIGLSILQNYRIYLDIKNGKIVIGKYDDVTVEEIAEYVRITFKKEKRQQIAACKCTLKFRKICDNCMVAWGV